MKHVYVFTAMAFLLALLMGGCGLLSSDSNGDTLPGYLAFSAPDDDGKNQIFTMRPDGSGMRQLTNMNGPSVQPSWSPDGERIVFSSYNQHTSIGPALWVMNADGSDLRPLHDFEPETDRTSALNGNNPRWSPDGTKIAFDLCVNCQISTNYAIFVFDLESEELIQLTEEPAGHSSTYPDWSPDGTRIAFTANRDYVDADTLRFRQDLYVMDADGSNQVRITETGFARNSVWSPIDNIIAFRSSSSSLGLFKVDIQSGDLDKIEENSSENTQLFPMAWSPDGEKLLITARDLNYPRDNSLFILDLSDIKLGKVYSQPTYEKTSLVLHGADWFVPSNN